MTAAYPQVDISESLHFFGVGPPPPNNQSGKQLSNYLWCVSLLVLRYTVIIKFAKYSIFQSNEQLLSSY